MNSLKFAPEPRHQHRSLHLFANFNIEILPSCERDLIKMQKYFIVNIAILTGLDCDVHNKVFLHFD